MDIKELLRLNVPKLREEALKIPNVVGVTAMKKDELVRLLAKAHGIELDQRASNVEKMEIKQRIRAFKARRDDALARKSSEELAQIRRGIRSLKRRSRQLARMANQIAAQAALAEASETTPAGSPVPEAPTAEPAAS